MDRSPRVLDQSSWLIRMGKDNMQNFGLWIKEPCVFVLTGDMIYDVIRYDCGYLLIAVLTVTVLSVFGPQLQWTTTHTHTDGRNNITAATRTFYCLLNSHISTVMPLSDLHTQLRLSEKRFDISVSFKIPVFMFYFKEIRQSDLLHWRRLYSHFYRQSFSVLCVN